MKCEKITNKSFSKENNCGVTPSKRENALDERLILKMDEEAPQHVFPERRSTSSKKEASKSDV